MDQTAGPTVPAPQASAPAVPRAGQAPGLSSDRIPGARLAYRGGVRSGRARGQRPVWLLQDELYFVEASRHLAFGYVDQPPLTPLLTRVAELPGLSPTAIRIIPALAGGAVVVAGVPRRLTAAALLPAVMGTIMDHPCHFRSAGLLLGVTGRNPRVWNRRLLWTSWGSRPWCQRPGAAAGR